MLDVAVASFGRPHGMRYEPRPVGFSPQPPGRRRWRPPPTGLPRQGGGATRRWRGAGARAAPAVRAGEKQRPEANRPARPATAARKSRPAEGRRLRGRSSPLHPREAMQSDAMRLRGIKDAKLAPGVAEVGYFMGDKAPPASYAIPDQG